MCKPLANTRVTTEPFFQYLRETKDARSLAVRPCGSLSSAPAPRDLADALLEISRQRAMNLEYLNSAKIRG